MKVLTRFQCTTLTAFIKHPALVGVIFVYFSDKIQIVRIVHSEVLFKLHRGDMQ
jgi:hypothetical protein